MTSVPKPPRGWGWFSQSGDSTPRRPLANGYDMELLFAIPFNYNIRNIPLSDGSWPFDEWDRPETRIGEDIYGVHEARLLLEDGHELSLHGYNHRSLLGDAVNRDDPNFWLKKDSGQSRGGSFETMRSSVAAARNRWILDGLGPLPGSYVAPNNLLAWNRAEYPWLEWISTDRAAARIGQAMESEVAWTYDRPNAELTVSFSGAPSHLWLRTPENKRIDRANLTGAVVLNSRKNSAEEGALYVLRCFETAVRIPCRNID